MELLRWRRIRSLVDEDNFYSKQVNTIIPFERSDAIPNSNEASGDAIQSLFNRNETPTLFECLVAATSESSNQHSTMEKIKAIEEDYLRSRFGLDITNRIIDINVIGFEHFLHSRVSSLISDLWHQKFAIEEQPGAEEQVLDLAKTIRDLTRVKRAIGYYIQRNKIQATPKAA